MRIQDLKKKEIINACSCRVLGCARDLEFDLQSGCICSLIVTAPSKWGGWFSCDYEYVIPISCITQVGPDIILVEVEENRVRQKIKMT